MYFFNRIIKTDNENRSWWKMPKLDQVFLHRTVFFDVWLLAVNILIFNSKGFGSSLRFCIFYWDEEVFDENWYVMTYGVLFYVIISMLYYSYIFQIVRYSKNSYIDICSIGIFKNRQNSSLYKLTLLEMFYWS